MPHKSNIAGLDHTRLADVTVDGELLVKVNSGTVGTTGGLTDTQLRATPFPVIPYADLSSAVDGYLTLSAAGDTPLIAAPGAARIHITSFAASNTSTTGVRIDFKDGSTVKHSFYLAPSGGGFTHVLPFPWRLTSNTALNVAISGSVTDVRVSATGFTS